MHIKFVHISSTSISQPIDINLEHPSTPAVDLTTIADIKVPGEDDLFNRFRSFSLSNFRYSREILWNNGQETKMYIAYIRRIIPRFKRQANSDDENVTDENAEIEILEDVPIEVQTTTARPKIEDSDDDDVRQRTRVRVRNNEGRSNEDEDENEEEDDEEDKVTQRPRRYKFLI